MCLDLPESFDGVVVKMDDDRQTDKEQDAC